MIRLILGIEILSNAANITFIAFSAYALPGFIDPLAQSFVTVSIGIAGSVTAVALTLVVYVYKQYGTLDVREIRRFKG
jgi:multicomponent Na+:H+ antiporter subunit C